MRVLVFGGRDFNDKDLLFPILDKCLGQYGESLEIISGMARGADILAWEWAKCNNVKCHEFPADWNKHKKAAGPIRNQQMLVEGKPDYAIGCPGGTGTNDMANRLRKAQIYTVHL